METLSVKDIHRLNAIAIESTRAAANITRGGCGLYAKELKKHLVKCGYDAKLVLMHWGADTINSAARANATNKMLNVFYSGWSHIMVEVGDYIVDSEGVEDRSESITRHNMDMFTGVNLDDKILDDMLKHCSWNYAFNTRKMPTIRKIMREKFAA